MNDAPAPATSLGHSHVFLGQGNEKAERSTWTVVALCGAMMVLEIVGGVLFGSIALVADGLHMSTHAGALLLAALAYSYARKHAQDPRFTFGTGKLGDLAGFTSAIVLAMVALLIAYEGVTRLFAPVPIHFSEAIPIAVLGLAVNVGSAWLLSRGGHHHGHGPGNTGQEHAEERSIETPGGVLVLSLFEDGVPPVFRVRPPTGQTVDAASVMIETVRPDSSRQIFAMGDRGQWLESVAPVPEPHEFAACIRIDGQEYSVTFKEHEHSDHGRGAAQRDNNMRAAIVHVAADAAVSVAVIVGLLLARSFGWLWMDPLAGIIGAFIIASWSFGLMRDTGSILLDMSPDKRVAEGIRKTIEEEGDEVIDLHLWRLGPGHLGTIVSVVTAQVKRGPDYYRRLLSTFPALSHVTVEVHCRHGHALPVAAIK